jgi:hypothetical protein
MKVMHYLNRERPIVLLQQLAGEVARGKFGGISAHRIEEHVGVEEAAMGPWPAVLMRLGGQNLADAGRRDPVGPRRLPHGPGHRETGEVRSATGCGAASPCHLRPGLPETPSPRLKGRC